MKAFILSSVIFLILIILIVINSIYIHKSCDEMQEILRAISPTDKVKINNLCSFWENHKMIFSISIHDSQIEKISELTESIKSAATNGDDAEFNKSIILLNGVLDEIKKNEEISFQGII